MAKINNIQPESIPNKWRTLLLLSFAEFLAMAVWFSASSVVVPLTDAWGLNSNGQAWLTMSVQIGFVVGALVSSVLTLADRIPAHILFTASAISAGIMTALIPLLADGLTLALIFRFLTGVFLAGVYPVGMKIMTTWTRADRGLGIGLLVGALTLGSASPHLLTIFGGISEWQPVLYLASALAIIGGLIGIIFIKEGPFKSPSPKFNIKDIRKILSNRDVMLANIGYLGHMWELYAMWAWILTFLQASYQISGVAQEWASVLTFGVIGIGGLGSLIAGKLADKIGRTTVTTISLVVSGSCAIVIGQFFGGSPILIAGIALLWGFAIVADSAQFSACVTELCDRQYIGTALTLQTSLGFLLTLITIRALPNVENAVGWEWAFAFLALGPIIGIWAMQTLRKSPTKLNLAGGRG